MLGHFDRKMLILFNTPTFWPKYFDFVQNTPTLCQGILTEIYIDFVQHVHKLLCQGFLTEIFSFWSLRPKIIMPGHFDRNMLILINTPINYYARAFLTEICWFRHRTVTVTYGIPLLTHRPATTYSIQGHGPLWTNLWLASFVIPHCCSLRASLVHFLPTERAKFTHACSCSGHRVCQLERGFHAGLFVSFFFSQRVQCPPTRVFG